MVLVYSAVAGRVARSWLSGPILFVATGLVVGPLGLNVLRLEITANDLRVLAEAALAMVLFTDARGRSRRHTARPQIAGASAARRAPADNHLGFLVALAVSPALDLFAAALLAALLAPTDAALGAPVVSNPAVPAEMRGMH